MARWRSWAVLSAGVALVFASSGGVPARAATLRAVRSHTGVMVAVNANQSNNWSGYNQGKIEKAVSAGFHSISGDWIVPTATPHKSGESEFSSTWLGIGGGCEDSTCSQQDNTLIQTGTEQDIVYDALAGTTTPQYSAWYELIPQAETPVSLPVKPGDHMHAAVAESPVGSGNWTITLQNVTQGQTFTTGVTYQSTYGSAEWIAEAPTVVSITPLPPSAGYGPLPNLGTVAFSGAVVDGSSAGLTPAEQFQMVDLLGNPIATPSAPNATADGFGVCTYASTC